MLAFLLKIARGKHVPYLCKVSRALHLPALHNKKYLMLGHCQLVSYLLWFLVHPQLVGVEASCLHISSSISSFFLLLCFTDLILALCLVSCPLEVAGDGAKFGHSTLNTPNLLSQMIESFGGKFPRSF